MGVLCRLYMTKVRGNLGDIDPLNKVPLKRAISGVKKGPLYGVSLILGPRNP